MEATVKTINPSKVMEDMHAPWNKPAVCLRGRKFATCVVNEDTGIHLVKLPVKDYDRYAKTMAGATPAAVAKKFLAFTRREVSPKSITLGALELLTRVASGDIPTEDVEFKDEPIPTPAEPKRANGEATPRSSILSSICLELKIEPTVARRRLRKAGLHAPYDNEAAIRAALK